jgi:single-strand DNA-binding protein
MPDIITVTGLVATTPRHLTTSEGLPITSFRLASTQRRFDRSQERWIDAETNWYTISAFRQLAVNAASSIAKGERIVVAGRLRIREWESGDRTGTNIEIDADAIGHDLTWGTTKFSRSIATTPLVELPVVELVETGPSPVVELVETETSPVVELVETETEPASPVEPNPVVELVETPF